MDHPAFRVIGTLGTIVTAVSVINFETNSLLTNVVLLAIAAYSAIFFAINTVRIFAARPLVFKPAKDGGRQKIADHLIKQLSSAGRVAIFSRDLTWVNKGSTAESLLLTKARKNELTLFVSAETAITDKLKSEGADVRCYGTKGFNPRSRFTILNYLNSGTRIMIGAPYGETHIIKHYGNEDMEVVDLANDFIALLEAKVRKA